MAKVINILLVEDDSLDAIDLQRTLNRMGIIYKIVICKNGEEAVQFLRSEQHPVFTGLPDVLLLDLNMPRMNGLEFLQILRSTDPWKAIKVFVLTTSDESEDKAAMKNLGISGYIVKPLKMSNAGSMDSFNLMIDLMNM